MSKARIAKMLAEALRNTAKKTTKTKKKSPKKEDVNKITGAGAKSEPQKGHLKSVKGKVGKVMDEQTIKGLDKVDMGQFARAQARGGKKAEGKMTAMQKLQREFEGLTKKAKIAEIAKGSKSKYYSVIKKIKGLQKGGSGTRPEKEIDPKSIRTKGQFENLLAKGRLEGLSNDKIVDIALRVGYITADEMMGNAKGGAMMKKKGMARGGMKKKGMARGGMKKKGMARGGMKKKGMAMGGLKKPAANQTGLKKLPSAVRNKMGYAQKGGSMKKKGMARGGMKKKGYAAGGMTVSYKVGGMAKGKMYGSVDNRKKK
tara:strand:- start:236 stop:1177 length:942 start_codon:yes stop_codon:yes gene_type:complete